MGVMPTRRYEQRLRAASAEQTRRRVLDAMYEQLPRVASIEAVAQQAGVARSTVYLIFGSRAGLFDAMTRDVLDRGGFGDVVKAVQNPDPLVHLRESLRASCRVYATQREVLYTLRTVEHSLDGALQRAENGRLGGMEYLASRLREQSLLSVSEDLAVDMLWMLSSFDTFDVLYTGRGLPTDEVADRLITMAERALLRAEPALPQATT
jgi:AcrR family transcriptional regulator